jgi:sodium/bile acid cotransporter 7
MRDSGRAGMRRIFSALDPFILGLLATVLIASLLPARGLTADYLAWATKIFIGILFFLYGSRLSPREALDGLRQWRLHGVILGTTFVIFPLLGLACRAFVPWAVPPQLYVGIVFLSVLPSTVQSSIAFTSIARGNVAAAICSASFSNLLGIVLTPILVAVLLGSTGAGFSWDSVFAIALQLLAPFALGQLLRRWTVSWIMTRHRMLRVFDRGSILLVVYSAFSASVVEGLWTSVSITELLVLVGISFGLLGIVLGVTVLLGRVLHFSRGDRLALLFCGSKKSLATGVPMASVLFSASTVGYIVLPVMLFHQIQLIVCALIARRAAPHEPLDGAAVTP